MKYILDASAVLAFLRNEPGSERIGNVLADPFEVGMHSVNLLEVYYKLASYGGEITAKESIDDIVALGVKINEKLDKTLRLRSGYYKIRYPFLSLADSICVAFAELSTATVLTTDRPFANIAEQVSIALIR